MEDRLHGFLREHPQQAFSIPELVEISQGWEVRSIYERGPQRVEDALRILLDRQLVSFLSDRDTNWYHWRMK